MSRVSILLSGGWRNQLSVRQSGGPVSLTPATGQLYRHGTVPWYAAESENEKQITKWWVVSSVHWLACHSVLFLFKPCHCQRNATVEWTKAPHACCHDHHSLTHSLTHLCLSAQFSPPFLYSDLSHQDQFHFQSNADE